MTGRTLIMVFVALLISVATVIVLKNRTQPVVAQAGPKVLVAVGDIPAGSFVRADKQLSFADWPQGNVAPSFITPSQHKIEEFNGGVARRTILDGEPITNDSLVRSTEGGFMSAVLTPGARAVSIAVNSTSGNAGFIFPGDHVDLILTHKIPAITGSNGDVLASETFVRDVRVLAIDQMLDNPDKKAVMAKTITLEVTPKQAEMINVASNLGALSVSLRSLSNMSEKEQAMQPQVSSGASPAIKPPANNSTVTTPVVSPSSDDKDVIPDNAGYSTSTDVSKLMGDKNEIRAKVSVYHGSVSAEKLDFNQDRQ